MKKTKLRTILDKRGVSALALSRIMKDVSARNVQAIAQGVRSPSLEVARKIARALKVKLDEIL